MLNRFIVLPYFANQQYLVVYMELSVIIVNYNVKHFLEQCLCSVEKAIATIDAEVIVVDNNSTDDSIGYLQPRFPSVQFIVNTTNIGFGKANNLAMAKAMGKYLLLLNPDTIVPEDCFVKCMAFFEGHRECGALGVKMIDGGGRFLPESKRSFPSPLTSFFKLAGLSSLFPTSKLFNRYALGFLSANGNHEVDVLCGAFFMMSKQVALETKGFDPAFFMYGEDIDLSYRIQKLGFKNYYFSGSCIVHFKGESAIQQTFKHNRIFYEAMLVFVKKHYGGGKASLFALLLQIAIGARSVLGFVGRLFKSSTQVLQQKQPSNFLFFGGKVEIAAAEKSFAKPGAGLVVAEASPFKQLQSIHNSNIVFCEGEGLDNSTIIQLIDQQPTSNHYWFHAKKSNSIVGSQFSNSVGNVIEQNVHPQ